VVGGPVAQFVVMGLFSFAVVGFATAVASRRLGEREAIIDARTTTLVKAQTVVEPVLLDGLATGDPVAVARLAEVVPTQVLDHSLVRVKIWTRTGRIVYSDEPRLIGNTYPLGADEVTAIDRGEVKADVSDLSAPENQFDRSSRKLLEVYLPVGTPNGDRLLFEAYYRYDAVAAAGSRIWRSFAPISLTALAVLEILQIPLAWSLAKRLRQRQREREGLLREALEASDRERRRIASDLHDGVVQDLAGVTYALAGAARQQDTPPAMAATFGESAAVVRKTMASLRSLLVEIYPPDLAEEGLGPALADLLAGAGRHGLSTSLDEAGLRAQLPQPVAALLYRVAQEALRNVVAHSRAGTVHVRLFSGPSTASVEVADDGVGFDAVLADARAAQGHLGLKGLKGLVGDAGGRLDVTTGPGQGTMVSVEVPLR